MGTTSQAYLESSRVKEISITVKVHDDSVPKPEQLVVMSPSGVQKERMMEEDMYVLSPSGSVLYEPLAKPWPYKPPKCSDCGPLFMKAYEMRNAGAVIHSHGMESCLVTMLDPSAKEFRITHMEMIKGIQGHGYYDELVVPIIENTAHERELTDSLAEAIKAYPKTTAVLVRNHGIYIWGDSWISAKTQTVLSNGEDLDRDVLPHLASIQQECSQSPSTRKSRTRLQIKDFESLDESCIRARNPLRA
ncbi:UNVERIFIED_CONTAM: putative bifunctional methylthioribulose-1-phosphate dehydratase/enolase-phosphatase E1 1 [Sesamum calycinum]|uniref:Bifunctional methylthioribulose-1-phosphate dehydratase/enolase-phosphatase E1 1 n=1 Tax=Sesamum calycinum TaxID=2727403 RepID=A0AAW2Q534_9LAMI